MVNKSASCVSLICLGWDSAVERFEEPPSLPKLSLAVGTPRKRALQKVPVFYGDAGCSKQQKKTTNLCNFVKIIM